VKRLRRVLVANRGEIALRIIRACRELGIEAVAVYSEADRLSPHVFEADEAHLIGPPPSSESYLRRALIEGRARPPVRRRASRLRLPGRAGVLRRYGRGGRSRIRRPVAAAIAAMGDKTEARRRMIDAGVPVVPGVAEPLADADAALEAAGTFGYPVLLKAAAGGGGKGMRIVYAADELRRAFARRECGGARRPSATAASTWRSTCRGPGTSRSRCSPMRMATWSISASATARSSAGTRR
jgi:acetyl-CoA carboxylase, biotin carboxylase subunit